jgi:hypothetical protein
MSDGQTIGSQLSFILMYRKKMKYQEGSVGNSRQDVRLANDSQSTEFSKLLTRTRSKSLYRERVRVNATAGKRWGDDLFASDTWRLFS